MLLSHQSGIQSAQVTIDSTVATLLSGVSVDGASRFSLKLPDAKTASSMDKAMAVDIKLNLVGVEHLSVLPVGNDNTLKLSSTWPHPSFAGAFLPREKTISEQGFDATWRVSSLATDAQARFPCGVAHTGAAPCAAGMVVNLVDPVNPAALSERGEIWGAVHRAHVRWHRLV